jgi:hypothetical protein
MASDFNPGVTLSTTVQSVVSASITVSAGSKLMATATGVATTSDLGVRTQPVLVSCVLYLGATASNAIGATEIASNVNTASLAVTGYWSSLPAATEVVSLRCSSAGGIGFDHVTINVWGGG